MLLIFQCFHGDAASMKWPFLEGILGPNCPKYCPILLKFVPVVFKESSNFYENCTLPKFALIFSFCPTLTLFYSMKEAEIEKTKCCIGQNLAIGLSKIAKSRPYLVSIFQEKYDYFFLYFGYFDCQKEGHGHLLKGWSQNLTYPVAVSQFLGMFLWKRFCISIFQICGYNDQRSFFF